jgi:GAF domain-containing protein
MSNTSSPQTDRDNFFSYEQWRERFLKVVLQGACILGFIAILLYLFSPSIIPYKILAIMTYGILVLVTLFNKVPYRLRAGIFLFLLYFAGFSSLIDHGIADASILFLGFIVMASLLFSLRAGIYSTIILTLLTIVLFGWSKSTFEDAARLTAILLVVSTIIAIGLHTFQEEFAKTQGTARQTLDTLREERFTLEQRVEDRTAGLARKTDQLRATSYIARKTAEVQDLATLLNRVAKLVTDQFGFYHTGIFLINETEDHVMLQAASSEGGERMIARGHSLSIGTQGIVGYVAAQKKPRIALDVGEDAVFFNNPDLPMTRSEVALPLLVRNKVLGVLDIQSDKPQAFRTEDIDVLQTLSDQIAVAIENARLLDETQAAILQLEALTGIRTREAWTQKLHENNRVFTYTPLGMRAEKLPHTNENVITAPIILRGQKIGNISIARKGDAKWNKLEEGLLDEVAGQVGLAVDNIRLLEEATQRAKQEQTVGRLATRFGQSLDIDTLLRTAARELGQLPEVEEATVFMSEITREDNIAGAQGNKKSRAA